METAAASQLSSAYDPKAVEPRWLDEWDRLGIARMGTDPAKPPFAMACPPPNVTGVLHLGHAVNGTIQDALARAKRMQGYAVLWQPGTDHAGISTQMVVERKIWKERKQTRHELGRDAFLNEVWAWKVTSGNAIIGQYRRLGATLDPERWRFTMDEGYTRAVRVAFKRLYEKRVDGEPLIYRGFRSVNWCPRCLTSLSDLEVVHREEEGTLYTVRYPVEGGGREGSADGSLCIATVRPETILADVAVAVHPEDPRYHHLVGQQVRVPLADRLVPVIADTYVEREFGTGALKITPAHDPNDFEIGQRHGLPVVDLLTKDAKLTDAAGEFAGMDRFEAREAVVQALVKEGLLVEEKPYRHAVGHCDRCGTVVEPRLCEQWYVRMKPLADEALAAQAQGMPRFHPARWAEPYRAWLDNIRDWCISRQLWWGHRIPVFSCAHGHAEAYLEDRPEACRVCGDAELTQDPDVLDTWFSSALWPFATLGWPDAPGWVTEAAARRFYPTTALSTARDILYLWVARMVFSGLEFVGEPGVDAGRPVEGRTERMPFGHVIIHATILDRHGQRMSKSKGTGVDPLDMMDRYGTDACRLWFANGTSGQDIRFMEEKLEESRNFANKLWNASRFVLMNLSDPAFSTLEAASRLSSELALADGWILARLSQLVALATQAFGAPAREADGDPLEGATLELHRVAEAAVTFFWGEFCDWYLELSKPRLRDGDRLAQGVLLVVLDTVLRILHPLMPFITEELYQQLATRRLVPGVATLQHASWPSGPEDVARWEAAERGMAHVIDVIRTVRNMRSELGVPPSSVVPELVFSAEGEHRAVLAAEEGTLAFLARVRPEGIRFSSDEVPQAATALVGDTRIQLPLANLLDLDKERDRLGKELGKVRSEQERLANQLGNQAFLAKAPAPVIEKLHARQADLETQEQALAAQLARLST